ncbi:hypothetical protein AX17_004271 [Amanita inopinata Kibby_2008]|nr:hypothetical protein AX17_004271 [Amanita inopinata Kibby_2008]
MSSIPYTSHHVIRDPRMSRLASETTRRVVGPMPVKTFLELYVPTRTSENLRFNRKATEQLVQLVQLLEDVDEIQMYEPWIKAMNRYSPNFKIHDVHDEEFSEISIRPDIVLCSGTLNNGKIDPSKIELFGEFKTCSVDDPFTDDDPGTVEADDNQARDTLGQMAAYAACHMGIQHRTHVFQILVFRNYARLLRWDRSGVIVTEEISLEGSTLARFLWDFNHLSDAERGWDSCMRRPSQEVVDEAKSLLGESQEYWEVSLGEDHENVPHLVEGADIVGHITRTQDAAVDWGKPYMKSLRKLQHYILVVEEYGRPLTSFRSSRELLSAVDDAAIAHQQAQDKARILHRDISAGNIIITEEGRGLLIDWESAMSLTQNLNELSVCGRHDIPKPGPHERLDDIESFYHVPPRVVLRFVQHGLKPEALAFYLNIFFDHATEGKNGRLMWQGRLVSVENGPWRSCHGLSPPLKELLEGLRKNTIGLLSGRPGDAQEIFAFASSDHDSSSG